MASGSKSSRPVLLGKPAPMQLDFDNKDGGMDGDKDEKYVLRVDFARRPLRWSRRPLRMFEKDSLPDLKDTRQI